MPVPNWTYVTVRGTFKDAQDRPVRGKIIFTPRPERLGDFTGDLVVLRKSIAATLDAAGSFTVTLPATDDPDITPVNFTYEVREMFRGGQTYDISVPAASALTGIDITELTSFPDPSTGELIMRGPKGDTGPQGPAGPSNLVISADDPNLSQPGIWVQTGLGPNSQDFTIWIEDGS